MATVKGAGTRFKPGQSGNPVGPAKSLVKARRALARDLAEHATELCAITLERALSGGEGSGAAAAALVTLLASGFEAPPAGKNAAASRGASSASPIDIDSEVAA